MEIIFIWFVLAVLVGVFADTRGRSGIGFFLLALVLSPLLVFIILLVIRNVAEEERLADQRRKDDERKEFERKREHEKQLEALRAVAQPVATPPTSGERLSVAEEIEKLGDLLQRGLLTEDEFKEQKASALGRAR